MNLDVQTPVCTSKLLGPGGDLFRMCAGEQVYRSLSSGSTSAEARDLSENTRQNRAVWYKGSTSAAYKNTDISDHPSHNICFLILLYAYFFNDLVEHVGWVIRIILDDVLDYFRNQSHRSTDVC